jgi:hypothetical protein
MPASPPTLRDMIEEARDRGRTYEQLEAIAIDAQTGERASRSLLNNIVLGKVDRMPYDYHLRGIAVALGKPYEAVRRAAIAQWLPADSATDPEAIREEVIGEARRLRDLADETLDRLGDNGAHRAGA